MSKKYIVIIIVFCTIIFKNVVYANEEIIEDISQSFRINSYIETFESFMKENNIETIDLYNIYSDLISGKGLNYDNFLATIISNVVIQVKESFNSVLTLFIVIIIMALLTSLELDKNSEVIKITKLIVIVSISSILLKNYIEIVNMFKNIVNVLSYAMQISSTFLTGILIASGKITTTGIIEPLLLFISSAICVAVEYVVIPLFTMSIAMNIVSKISDNIKLNKISNMFRKSSLYIFSFAIAIFVLVLSLESSITKSIDNLYFKTTQSIVSDVVPVVGKFLSDSLNTVLGATELIGKIGGVISLIAVILIASLPLIKLVIIIFMYKLLSAFSEPINEDKTIADFLDGFSKVYSDMLGILIGIVVLFVMTTGIIMSMISTISA